MSDAEEPSVPSEEEIAADLAAEEPVAGAEERRYPSTIGGAFYLAILAATGVGLAIVALGSWRAGVRWIAGALLCASLLRLVLPRKDAGMLAVRHRLFDSVLLAAVGVVLIVLAGSIPDQPVV